MRIIVLLVLIFHLCAADPFVVNQDFVAKEAAMNAAIEAYAKAAAEAWKQADLKPVPVPPLSSDPKDSERTARANAEKYNETLYQMQHEVKRWVSTKGLGLNAAIYIHEAIKCFSTALKALDAQGRTTLNR